MLRHSKSRKSKFETRKPPNGVIPAKAGIHNFMDPRFRGGDAARSEFRFSSFHSDS
jgi:acyl CoA:acetate/3-ketoacid CoA transferase